MGWNHHGLEPVDVLKLVRFGVSGSCHARELGIHAEIILERDRGERLILALDRHAFLRLDRLMQAIRPAPARHQASGELVDNDDFVFLHHVLLITVVQRVRAQCRIQMMHQIDVARIVKAAAMRQ